PLDEFSLESSHARWMRRALKDAEKVSMTFDVVPASSVPQLLPTLRAVSDEWLAGKHTREKGFSLGRFDEEYLRRFPVATVSAPGPNGEREIVAFANLWCGAAGGEMAPDLMRTARAAPRGTMDYLFVK